MLATKSCEALSRVRRRVVKRNNLLLIVVLLASALACSTLTQPFSGTKPAKTPFSTPIIKTQPTSTKTLSPVVLPTDTSQPEMVATDAVDNWCNYFPFKVGGRWIYAVINNPSDPNDKIVGLEIAVISLNDAQAELTFK